MGAPFAVLLAVAGGYFGRAHPLWGCALLACGAWAFTRQVRRRAWRGAGALALALVAAAGWRGAGPRPLAPLPLDRPLLLQGRVADDPSRTPEGFRVLLDLAPASSSRGARVSLHVRGWPHPAPGSGDQVRFRAALRLPWGLRNPGGSGFEDYLARRRVDARASAAWPGQVLFAEPGPGSPAWMRWRRETARALARAVPGQPGAVLTALTLGDWSGIEPETSESFRRAGTLHLVAISGMHLGILALLLLPPTRWALARLPGLALRWPIEPLARLLVLPALVAYAGLSGFQTSTLRALALASLLLVGEAVSRPSAPLGLLAASAALLALPAPELLADPGFQLSVAALAGLFWLAPRLEARLGGAPEHPDPLAPEPGFGQTLAKKLATGGRRVVCAGLAASLATAPVCSFHFGSSSLLGLALNPLAVPLAEFLCLPLALTGTALHGLWPGGAVLLWQAAGLGIRLLLRLQEALVPWVPPVSWPALRSLWGLLGSLGLFIALGLALDRPLRARAVLAAALTGCLALAVTGIESLAQSGWNQGVRLWALDVGQGQAVTARLPDGRWLLVDAGGFPGSDVDTGLRVVVPTLETLGARRLWVAASTHPHPDHVLGLPSVVRRLRPAALWLPESYRGDSRYGPVLAAAREVGARVDWLGNRPHVASFQGGRLLALAPAGADENDRSLAIRLECGTAAALLPGDLTASGQEALLASGFPLSCDVLVAPHHGSRGAVNVPFLRAAAPRHVLVSAAGRRGLPSEEFLAAARAGGAETWVTADRGCLASTLGPEGATAGPWSPPPRPRLSQEEPQGPFRTTRDSGGPRPARSLESAGSERTGRPVSARP